MEYKSLGRTGLNVSVAGIGCGGHSRLGQQYNVNKEHSIALLLEAMDLGVNFIDTAQNYRTEEIVGDAIRHRIRSDIILSTKTYIRHGAGLLAADDLLDCIDQSLRNLSTDYVDIYHLHGVQPSDYRYAKQELLPALLKAKDAGKIRCVGLTEATSIDPQHETLQMAMLDGGFDVTMFAFHIMHQNARHLLMPMRLIPAQS